MGRSRSLPAAARSGDRLAALRSLRDRLATEIHQCASARDVAGLAKQLRDTMGEIATLTAGTVATKESDTFDELSRRRADRGADSTGGQRSAGREPG